MASPKDTIDQASIAHASLLDSPMPLRFPTARRSQLLESFASYAYYMVEQSSPYGETINSYRNFDLLSTQSQPRYALALRE
ncbi:hypothetical protein M422DRAFT_242889 [Sphaerobolus stellatus SS14]|uniref:Uncharacterized protein n=1 Tax=Sphaerobolus stellatus (strain SS14) TaxID=990650 RepID=A0A0C9UJW6_SPHS4|nr:hypothetical protein M422DRAFT_273506 [Sphaerobolus stellatus SS14]KIJ52931.1 hypothetical protein M422DRAFT_242889 [Sphaerobolus stellatus SS14]